MNIEKALQKTVGFGVREFVEKAIEGGWQKMEYGFPFPIKPEQSKIDFYKTLYPKPTRYEIFAYHCGFGQGVRESWFLLDPAAWRAVVESTGIKSGMKFLDVDVVVSENEEKTAKSLMLTFMFNLWEYGD